MCSAKTESNSNSGTEAVHPYARVTSISNCRPRRLVQRFHRSSVLEGHVLALLSAGYSPQCQQQS